MNKLEFTVGSNQSGHRLWSSFVFWKDDEDCLTIELQKHKYQSILDIKEHLQN